MKKHTKILSLILALLLVLPGMLKIVEAARGDLLNEDVKAIRLSGGDRSKTSIAVSKEAYPKGADAIILSGYHGNSDAITGTLLASSENAPLLIAGTEGLTDELKAEITRLNPKKAFVLGGKLAVPESVDAELKQMNIEIERIQGKDRYETAAKLAEKAVDTKHVFLALGNDKGNFGQVSIDALAVGPASAKTGYPVLLTESTRLSENTKKAMADLGVERVTIIGGKLAITERVQVELEKMRINVDRIEGSNRYETAVTIANKYFANSTEVVVAYGLKNNDVFGYLGAMNNAPILLTPTNKLPESTKKYIEMNTCFAYVLGGKLVVSENVFNEIVDAIQCEVLEPELLKAEFQEDFIKNFGRVNIELAHVKGANKFRVKYHLKDEDKGRIPKWSPISYITPGQDDQEFRIYYLAGDQVTIEIYAEDGATLLHTFENVELEIRD